MKLVNEKLAGLKLQIGKEVVTVTAKGELEIDDKDLETIEAMIQTGFVPAEGEKKPKAPKAPQQPKAPPAPKDPPKEDPKDDKKEEPKSRFTKK